MASTTSAGSSRSVVEIVVKFMPPNSCRLELSFFEKLYELKLNEMKLAVSDVPVRAFLDSRGGQMVLSAASLQGYSQTDLGGAQGNGHIYSNGVLKNVNTANVS